MVAISNNTMLSVKFLARQRVYLVESASIKVQSAGTLSGLHTTEVVFWYMLTKGTSYRVYTSTSPWQQIE